MKARLIAGVGDRIYISGEETIVRKNGFAGKHQWTTHKGQVSQICLRLAQDLLDSGEATFYRRAA